MQTPKAERYTFAFKIILPKLEATPKRTMQNAGGETEKVLALLRSKETIGRKDVEQLLGVSSATATRLLAQMVSEQQIDRVGARRSARYVLR